MTACWAPPAVRSVGRVAPPWGAVCVSKGVAAVLLMRLLWPTLPLGGSWPIADATIDTATVDVMVALGAIAALLGHSRPIWLGFRGGKSVATGLGILFAMQWPVALASLGTFTIVLGLSRIVSLSSMVAALAMALAMFVTTAPLPYLLFALVGAGFVILRHQGNIERLLAGTEPKLGQSAVSS